MPPTAYLLCHRVLLLTYIACCTPAQLRSHSSPCSYLLHAIGHFTDNLPQPEQLLEVLLHRPWLPSAYPKALERLWLACKGAAPGAAPFSITRTTRLVLAAAPEGLFEDSPAKLLPALTAACQPELSLSTSSQLEAIQLLLSARGAPWPAGAARAPWPAGELVSIITSTITAQPQLQAPTQPLTQEEALFQQRQLDILQLLLDHCWAPAVPGTPPTAFIYDHIKSAVFAGAPAAVLELLLSRAPQWRPDNLRTHTDAGESLNSCHLRLVLPQVALAHAHRHGLQQASAID